MNIQLVSLVVALMLTLGAVAPALGITRELLKKILPPVHNCLGVKIYWPAEGPESVGVLPDEEQKRAQRKYNATRRECSVCCKKDGWKHYMLVHDDDPDFRICDCADSPVVENDYGMVTNFGR